MKRGIPSPQFLAFSLVAVVYENLSPLLGVTNIATYRGDLTGCKRVNLNQALTPSLWV